MCDGAHILSNIGCTPIRGRTATQHSKKGFLGRVLGKGSWEGFLGRVLRRGPFSMDFTVRKEF